MSIIPDAYTISHFSYQGLEQTGFCLTACQDGSLRGMAATSASSQQDWLIAKCPEETTPPRFSIQSLTIGLYIAPREQTVTGKDGELQLSKAAYYWDLARDDMSYRILTQERRATVAIDLRNPPKSQLCLSTDLQDQTQLWTFIPTWRDTPIACGTYHIKNDFSQSCMDLYYSLSADNTPVTVYPYHGGANQTWKLTMNPETSHYWVQCIGSGTYLSYTHLVGPNASGQVVVGHSSPVDWTLKDNGEGLLSIHAAGTNLLVDLDGEQVTNGTKLRLAHEHQSPSETRLFTFERAKTLSKKKSNTSFTVFKLLGTRAKTKSSASLSTADSCGSLSTVDSVVHGHRAPKDRDDREHESP